MTGTMAVPSTDTATRDRLAAIGWLHVAKSIVWFVGLVVLGAFGGKLERLVPGPDVVEAIAASLAVGVVTVVTRVPFDLAIKSRSVAVYGRDAIEKGPPASLAGVLIALPVFVLWFAVRASGTLLILPLLMAVIVYTLERPFAVLISRFVPGLEDAALERRLMRFARETGLGQVKIIVSGDTRRSIDRDIEVTVIGGVIDVPRIFVGARPDVLETRLAAAVVRLGRDAYLKRLVIIGVQLLTVGLIVLLIQSPLVRSVDVAGVTAPGFIPMMFAILSLSFLLSTFARAAFNRWRACREIGRVLELTRAPDAMLALIEDDANTVDQINPLKRFWSGRPFATLARAEVDRWMRSRRVTLLFTDIANSTEFLNELGDERWYHVVADHDHVVRSVVEEFDGEEIDSAGDGFFIVFDDAGRAVLAAIELQRRLRDIEVRPGEPVGVRMGVHTGEAIRRGREVVGREVNLAARIGASAVPGEILVSQELRDELVESARFTFGEMRAASLKGFSDDHVVYPVSWDTDRVLAD